MPGGVDRVDGAGRADGIGFIGGRGIELVGLGRPLEITRDSPAGGAAGACVSTTGVGAGVSTTAAGASITGVGAGASTTAAGASITGVGAGASTTGTASIFAAAVLVAAAFFAGAFLAAAFFAGAATDPSSASTFFTAAFLAAAFLTGFSSSGCASRFNPSLTAFRRTRSACASSIEDDTPLTSMPIVFERSSASLFVRPSSFASSAIRIFLTGKG
jgi:hypothetical protein